MDSRWLLICDVDGTVYHDTPEARADTAKLAEYVEANRASLCFVLNSGRFPESVLETVKTSNLPEPDLVIGGVGTQMQLVREGAVNAGLGALPEAYRQHLSTGYDAERVRETASHFAGLDPQPDEFQSAHKTSFYWHDASDEQLDELRAALTKAGQQADVVYSSKRDLDVLPVGINKAAACRFVVEQGGFDPKRVVVAGDTGNDAAMLTAGYRAVVVGNALPDLDHLAGDLIYRANGHVAAGVLEGLTYWQDH